ncbi:MAG: hypothetical protein EOO05_04085 [Chitinophagaceae bacterium]|nr:MAG: hypothetical protein EOO05_04085 [Chitinophagaceae bacterium]
MRFILAVIVCSFILLVACHRKTSPAAVPESVVIAPVIKDTVAVVKAPDAAPGFMAGPGMITPVSGSAMDNEAGRMIYTTKCAKCHESKPVDHWNQAEWQPILKSMIKKSRLDSLQDFQVRLYVNTHAKKS